jgi:hypothetical protein
MKILWSSAWIMPVIDWFSIIIDDWNTTNVYGDKIQCFNEDTKTLQIVSGRSLSALIDWKVSWIFINIWLEDFILNTPICKKYCSVTGNLWHTLI